MLLHPFRPLVLLLGALWPAFVVTYLLLFADRTSAADTASAASAD
jgi:hypothetical protein